MQREAHPEQAMSEAPKPKPKPKPQPPLQKPPGYRDPAAPPPPALPRPPPRLPPSLRHPDKPAPRRPGRRRHPCSCCRVICWISGILTTIALLLAIASTLAYLWFQPRIPVFRIISVQAPRLRLSPGPDGALLDSAAVFKIRASNPNGKISLDYGGSEARVAVADDDGDIDAGSAAAAGFVQGRRNSTVLRYEAAVKGVLVGDVVGPRLSSRIKSREIRFSVEVRAGVGIRVSGKRTGRVPIRVVCRPASLKQVASGAALPRCHIYLFRWINLH